MLRQPNKVSFINHSNTPGISMHTFLKEGKTKTKMDDLCQDSQNDLPTEYFALCSEHFEASFQQKFAYWDASRFQEVWQTFSTNNRCEVERLIGQSLPKK